MWSPPGTLSPIICRGGRSQPPELELYRSPRFTVSSSSSSRYPFGILGTDLRCAVRKSDNSTHERTRTSNTRILNPVPLANWATWAFAVEAGLEPAASRVTAERPAKLDHSTVWKETEETDQRNPRALPKSPRNCERGSVMQAAHERNRCLSQGRLPLHKCRGRDSNAASTGSYKLGLAVGSLIMSIN